MDCERAGVGADADGGGARLGQHLQQVLTSGLLYQLFCNRAFGTDTRSAAASPILELLELLPSLEVPLDCPDARRHAALLESTAPFHRDVHNALLSKLIQAAADEQLDLMAVCKLVGRFAPLHLATEQPGTVCVCPAFRPLLCIR
jgi:hypothetical protein